MVRVKETLVRVRPIRALWIRRFAKRANAQASEGLQLNLACGLLQLPGWTNIDHDPACRPDLTLTIQEIGGAFAPGSCSRIMVNHGLGYLSYLEAAAFFKVAFTLLHRGGTLEIETPDGTELARRLMAPSEATFLSAAQALLAVSRAGSTHGTPYKSLWRQDLLKTQLHSAGFHAVTFAEPQSRSADSSRDLRCRAERLD